MYEAEFDQDWPGYFQPLANDIKERIAKKIRKVLEYPQRRHLKEASFFVDEVGQYRIVYRVFEENKRVRFYFVGSHKEYEKWYKQAF
jgi:mRNA-degrading endonuclease RelE of RelBE toxin-antitoxin system